ncbi:MAG: type III pantothenate kinase [Ignavibacteriales bacterium]|nr:MAG: type III pantothenate kinase [Ignavibacteriales bacterium]
MLIAIDIGNTRIKAGLLRKNKLIQVSYFNNTDELTGYINSVNCMYAAVSSVVPEKTEIVKKNINTKNVFIISHKVKTNLNLSYTTPETLGTDRLSSAEGAFYLFNKTEAFKNYSKEIYILSIDFGTATTVNVIEYPGKFTGGLIAPGIDMMFSSLNQNTAVLPLLNISNYNSIIGIDTNSSIAGGVITSAIGLIEKVIRYLKDEKSASEIFIYITGGNAKKIIPHLTFDFIYEEGLIFYGINSLWRLNKEFSSHQ